MIKEMKNKKENDISWKASAQLRAAIGVDW